MKKYILFTFAVMLAFAAAAQKKADIQFEKTTIDLGKFGSDKLIQKCRFVFKNTGDADLYIHQVMTSCGCTSKEYPKHAIKPGASDTIYITYDGSRKAPRKFRTSITIHSNAKQEMTKIYIKGEQLARPIKEVEEIVVEEE